MSIQISTDDLRYVRLLAATRSQHITNYMDAIVAAIEELINYRTTLKTISNVMCTCRKRFGEHPIQSPWWPCMVKSESDAKE